MRTKLWPRLLLVAAIFILSIFTGIRQPAQAHALPISYTPAQEAVLSAPPPEARIRFSEQLNPDISRIVVVNPSNQEVDNHDSQVQGDGVTMVVTLPLLPAGTYVVAWRSHSADDGHVAGGSYIFHIEGANGKVPPLTGKLPSGNIIGGASVSANGLDGPNLVAALAHWLALLGLTVILGLGFWWLFVRRGQSGLDTLYDAAAKRARLIAEFALEAIIAATLIEVAAQAIILDGTAQALTSAPLLSGILFHSRYGNFLVARVGLSVMGLLALWSPDLRASLKPRNQAHITALFGLALAVAFLFSGHGGSVNTWYGPWIDYLHLLANGVWLGGLIALAIVILPSLIHGDQAAQTRFVAASLPAFGVPALTAAFLLAVTGPLNAGARMTSFDQLWTTQYGVVLSIKIILFIIMGAISFYHAFRLRPRLAVATNLPVSATASAKSTGVWAGLTNALTALERAFAPRLATTTSNGGVALSGIAGQTSNMTTAPAEKQRDAEAHKLRQRIVTMIRAEAGIGLVVLLCAALLGPLAGTLAPKLVDAGDYGATGGAQTITRQVDGYTATLHIAQGKFGTNDFTLTLKNPDGSPGAKGAAFLLISMVEMDMGTNDAQLVESSTPGVYTGQGELPMAGTWNIVAVFHTTVDTTLHRAMFQIKAGY